MTDSRRDALICLALATAFAATGTYFAAQPSWWCAPAFYITTLLGWCERRLTADHRRQLAQHERARIAAAADSKTLAAPGPCCSFWVHSDEAIHGPDCIRSAA